MTATTLDGGITVVPGDPITVIVRDADGAPVEAARVAAAVGALPPSVAQTAADGSAALRVRAGGDPLSLVVTPPLPHARVEIAPTPTGCTSAPARPSRCSSRAATPRGSPSPRTTRPARRSPAPRCGSPRRSTPRPPWPSTAGRRWRAPSSIRLAALAGADGVVPPLILPRGSYEVIVDGAGSPARVRCCSSTAIATRSSPPDRSRPSC